MKSTVIANSNIAFVKYWGKKDEFLNIPMNPSISMTLDNSVSTKTTVEFSNAIPEDIFILDDELQSGEKKERVARFLDVIRKISGKQIYAKVESLNTFPTGSGIASSASGFAALGAAAAKAIGLDLTDQELSSLARQGSGSASRSIFGGFSLWEGECAVQLYDENYWSELRDIIVLLDDKEKKISSRAGMRETVKTSNLYTERLKHIEGTVREVKAALKKKDFEALAGLIMKESDELHACMADTSPKLIYLSKKSEEVRNIIIGMNKKRIIAGYSFDAGPNAHIITLEKNADIIIRAVSNISSRLIIARPGPGIAYSENHLA